MYTASNAAVLFNFGERDHIARMRAIHHLGRMDSGGVGESLIPPDVLRAIRGAVGSKGWIEGAGAIEPYLREERGLFLGHCAAVVRPATTQELARVVTLCAGAGIPVVPPAATPAWSAVAFRGAAWCCRPLGSTEFALSIR